MTRGACKVYRLACDSVFTAAPAGISPRWNLCLKGSVAVDRSVAAVARRAPTETIASSRLLEIDWALAPGSIPPLLVRSVFLLSLSLFLQETNLCI